MRLVVPMKEPQRLCNGTIAARRCRGRYYLRSLQDAKKGMEGVQARGGTRSLFSVEEGISRNQNTQAKHGMHGTSVRMQAHSGESIEPVFRVPTITDARTCSSACWLTCRRRRKWNSTATSDAGMPMT